jgi:hypothetical protein
MSSNPKVCCSVMYFCKRNIKLTNITIGRPASYIDLKKKDTEHHNIKMWIEHNLDMVTKPTNAH